MISRFESTPDGFGIPESEVSPSYLATASGNISLPPKDGSANQDGLFIKGYEEPTVTLEDGTIVDFWANPHEGGVLPDQSFTDEAGKVGVRLPDGSIIPAPGDSAYKYSEEGF